MTLDEVENAVVPAPKAKGKRDIVNMVSEKPMAINLEHVGAVRLEGKTIYFDLYTKTQPIELENEDAAKSVYQGILNLWAGEANCASQS